MKLLKTALLSSVLMMGATFGARELAGQGEATASTGADAGCLLTTEKFERDKKNAAGALLKISTFGAKELAGQGEATASTGADAGCLLITEKFERYKKSAVGALLKVSTRDIQGKEASELVLESGEKLNSDSELLSFIIYIRDKIKETVLERDSLKAQLAVETKAKQKLEKEKEAVEKEIAALNAAKKSTDKQLLDKTKELDTATQRVSELGKILNKLEESATKADEKAQAHIQELTKERDVAASMVKTLTADVKRLTDTNEELIKTADQAAAISQGLKRKVKLTDAQRRDLEELMRPEEDDEVSNEPLIAGRAYQGRGSQSMGSAFSADSLLFPRFDSSGLPVMQNNFQPKLTAKGLAEVQARQKPIGNLIDLDDAPSTPRGLQTQQEPRGVTQDSTAADDAAVEKEVEVLTDKQIKECSLIVKYVYLVLKGEPEIFKRPDKYTREQNERHLTSLNEHAVYKSGITHLTDNNIDVQKIIENSKRLNELKPNLENGRAEWTGPQPNKDQHKKKDAHDRITSEQKEYDKSYLELIRLLTTKERNATGASSPNGKESNQ